MKNSLIHFRPTEHHSYVKLKRIFHVNVEVQVIVQRLSKAIRKAFKLLGNINVAKP